MIIDATEQYNKAVDLLESGEDIQTAENIFNALLNHDPNSPLLLFGLGGVALKKKYYAHALYLFQRVIELKPDIDAAHNNLGYIYHNHYREFDKSRAHFEEAIKLAPDNPEYLMNLGATHIAMSESDLAIKYSDKALAINPNFSKAIWHKSLALLEQGDYKNGWDLYASCIRDENDKPRKIETGYEIPEWDGTKGKIIHIYGEQGIGDEIMFTSMLPDLCRDNYVIFEGHPRLYEIYRNSFKSDNLMIYGTRKDRELAWPRYYKIDYTIPIGSLGKFFRRDNNDFPGTPYLTADKKRSAFYSDKLQQLGDRPKIGISWKGGTKLTNAGMRNLPLNLWLPIFKTFDADWISLQYTEGASDTIKKFNEEHGITIHHWQKTIDDYDETAALVENLDLIISVPQSVVHLAGALGTPTFQLTPKRSMWQAGVYGQNMPWYNCVRNIWQDESEQWEPVIHQLKGELCKLYQMNIAA